MGRGLSQMDIERELRQIKKELKILKNDSQYKKIGLILQAILTAATVISLLK